MKGGYGTLTRADSSRYEGYWFADKRFGQGKIITASGTIHEGKFEYNNFVMLVPYDTLQ